MSLQDVTIRSMFWALFYQIANFSIYKVYHNWSASIAVFTPLLLIIIKCFFWCVLNVTYNLLLSFYLTLLGKRDTRLRPIRNIWFVCAIDWHIHVVPARDIEHETSRDH